MKKNKSASITARTESTTKESMIKLAKRKGTNLSIESNLAFKKHLKDEATR